MSGGMPELGSKISLISKADIRYEGRLYTVDPTECTIALSSVRSFGTEDRETQFQIAPQSQIYDYILFRGSDIKDIRVVNNGMPHPNDPAIMQVQLPNGQHLMPHFPMPTMNPPMGNYGNPFGAMGGLGGMGTSGLAPGSAAGSFMLNNKPKQPSELNDAIPQELNLNALSNNQQSTAGGSIIGGALNTNNTTATSILPNANIAVSSNSAAEHKDQDLLAGASRSTTPISLISRKSPSTDMAVQVNQQTQHQQQQSHQQNLHHNQQNVGGGGGAGGGGGGGTGGGGNRDAGHKRQNHQQRSSNRGGGSGNDTHSGGYYNRDRRDSGRIIDHQHNNNYNQGHQQQQQQHHDNRNNHYNHNNQRNNHQNPSHQQQLGGGGGGGTAGAQNNNRGWTMNRGGQNNNMTRNRGGRGRMPHQGFRQIGSGGTGVNQSKSNRTKNTIKFEQDFDFEQANNKFEELRSQLSKLKVGDEPKTEQINGETDKKDDSGNETGAGEHEPEDEEITVGYDKTKSFFDNISCEAAQDRSKSKKNDWRQERKLNSETFGVSSTRRGNYRGRGSYYNRNMNNYSGYNRSYRGGNNYTRNNNRTNRITGVGGGTGGSVSGVVGSGVGGIGSASATGGAGAIGNDQNLTQKNQNIQPQQNQSTNQKTQDSNSQPQTAVVAAGQ